MSYKEISDLKLSISLILNTAAQNQHALITEVETSESEYSTIDFIDSVSFYVNDHLFDYIPSDSLVNNPYCWGSVITVSKCYNYYSDSLPVHPSQTYILKAVYKDKIINGQTTVPGDFTISVSGKTISWTESRDAALYRISAFGERYVFETTTQNTTVTIKDDDFFPGTYRITVEALDKNFYDLVREKTTQAGLNGAYGIFGSVTVRKMEARLE